MAVPAFNQDILIEASKMAPAQAVEFFEAKGFKINWKWDETLNAANNKVFQVAKSMNMDVLQDIRQMVDKAIKEGITFEQFQKELAPKLQARGWWGQKMVEGPDGVETVQLGSPHRLKTIYRTNTQSAYNAGRWKRQKRGARLRPYLMLIELQDASARTTHKTQSGSIARIDSKFWKSPNSWYPPNGFNSFVPDTKMRGTIESGTRRLYDGNVFTIKTAKGRSLTITPNHPIPTDSGFVAAGNVRKGQKIFSYSASAEVMFSRFPAFSAKDVDNIPAQIQDIFDLLCVMRPLFTANVRADDFYSDVSGGDGNVDVVNLDRVLADRVKSKIVDNIKNFDFKSPDSGKCSHLTIGSPEFFLERYNSPPGSLPSRTALLDYGSSILSDLAPFKKLCLPTGSESNAIFKKCSFNDVSAYSKIFGNFLKRFSGAITFDEVVDVSKSNFSGHVYDLQCPSGLIIANNIVISNCRGRVRSLTEKEAKARGIRVKHSFPPDHSFGGNPGINLFKPIRKDYDPDIWEKGKGMDPIL
jgi:hypothetical protein